MNRIPPAAVFALLLAPAAIAADVDRYGDPLPEGAVARCGTVRFRYEWNRIQSSPVVSPDGRLIAVGTGERGITVWDAKTGRVIKQWETAKPVITFTFSQNGGTLAALEVTSSGGHFSWHFSIWETTTGTKIGQVPTERDSEHTPQAAFSGDGLVAVSSNDRTVSLWDVTGRKQLFSTRGDQAAQVQCISFAPDGRTFFSASYYGRRTWDRTGQLISQSTFSFPDSGNFQFSNDARLIALVPKPYNQIWLWDTTTGKRLRAISGDGRLSMGLVFSADNKRLASIWEKSADITEIGIADVGTGTIIKRFPIPNNTHGKLQFSGDGRIVLTTCGILCRSCFWDIATGQQINVYSAHEGRVTTLAFAPDGKTLLSGSEDGTIRVWNSTTGEPLRSLPGHRDRVNHIAMLPDSKSLLSCGDDDRFRFSDVVDGREIRRFDLGLGPEDKNASVPHQIITFGLSPDGQSACSYSRSNNSDRAVYHLWDMTTGKPLARHAFVQQPNVLAFTPDAKQVLEYVAWPNSRSTTPTPLVLRDLATLRPRLTLTPPEETEFVQAFSPDGQTLAAVTTRQVPKTENENDIASTIRLWEIATGQERQSLAVDAGGDFSRVERLAFSPDGRSLAVVRDDRRIQIWDVLTGRRCWQRGGLSSTIQSLAFSPDGRRLATGHGDSQILIWDVTPPDAAVRVATVAEQDADWQALAGDDAKAAWAAMARLASSPASTVALCRARLMPAEPVAADKIRALLAELDGPKFAAREAAFRELSALGESAEPILTDALTKNPSAELKQRLDRLLAPPRVVTSPEALRRLRAAQVLNWIGTAEAREALKPLAAGDLADRATSVARDALLRTPP